MNKNDFRNLVSLYIVAQAASANGADDIAEDCLKRIYHQSEVIIGEITSDIDSIFEE